MTRIYLLRHGETEWNSAGNRYCGITDIALNETGRRQARLAGEALASSGITAVYCSPLQRSRDTASIIGGLLALEPVADERLYELNFGSWEGLTRSEIEAADAEGWKAWLRNTDTARAGGTGDTGAEVAGRYRSFIQEQTRKRAGEETLLIVGHNTANRLFIADSLGLPLEKYRSLMQSNCGISALDVHGPEDRVWMQINETAHLRAAAP